MVNLNCIQDKVDNYLNTMTYKEIKSYRRNEIYNMFYSNICKLTLDDDPEMDPTNDMELSIREEDSSGIIEVTGYIKIDDMKFIHIEKLYRS